jgi:hypothetical protein
MRRIVVLAVLKIPFQPTPDFKLSVNADRDVT